MFTGESFLAGLFAIAIFIVIYYIYYFIKTLFIINNCRYFPLTYEEREENNLIYTEQLLSYTLKKCNRGLLFKNAIITPEIKEMIISSLMNEETADFEVVACSDDSFLCFTKILIRRKTSKVFETVSILEDKCHASLISKTTKAELEEIFQLLSEKKRV